MPDKRLIFLFLSALAACLAFMLVGARGSWDFLLVFRGTKLLTLIAISVAVAVATILFQTLSANRILTPSIMGLDALYVLLQTILVFVLGGAGLASLSAEVKFLASFLLLMFASVLLFGVLLNRQREDLFRLLLIGVIFGILFRSVSALISRLIDPSEFMILQGELFASFNKTNTSLLAISALMIGLCCIVVWRRRRVLDVMALGRETAIGLGVDTGRELFIGLVIVSALVATSTALVGPVGFFGLLVSALAYELMKTSGHGPVFIAAALISITIIVGGQTLFERVLHMGATLSVVIEFLGGITFLLIVFRKYKA
ncbi:iron chelate uptake ABC transporter family permease subunit [Roseibium limicola]